MKRAALAALILLVVACDLFRSVLAPPDWIQGTWKDAIGANTFRFTSDDVVLTTSTGTNDYKQLGRTSGVNISDSGSDTGYALYFTTSDTSQTFSFAKTTETTMNYTLNTNGYIQGPIALSKQ